MRRPVGKVASAPGSLDNGRRINEKLSVDANAGSFLALGLTEC